MNTEQDVKDFWNEVIRLQKQNESADPIIEYRLYYDDSGNITSGYPLITNRPEPSDLPIGSYIIVSKEDYQYSSDKVVKNGLLEKKRIL